MRSTAKHQQYQGVIKLNLFLSDASYFTCLLIFHYEASAVFKAMIAVVYG